MQDGYPTSFVTDVYQSLCVAWDPVTRLPRRNASDIYPGYGQTVALGGSNYQFNFGYVVQNVFTGDYITVGSPHRLWCHATLHLPCVSGARAVPLQEACGHAGC